MDGRVEPGHDDDMDRPFVSKHWTGHSLCGSGNLAMIREMDPVVLTQDLPEQRLQAGDVGWIVMAHRSGAGYEVEFVTLDGETISAATVPGSAVRFGAGDGHRSRADGSLSERFWISAGACRYSRGNDVGMPRYFVAKAGRPFVGLLDGILAYRAGLGGGPAQHRRRAGRLS
jgi:Domain of unknown function (DUF4926)